MTRCSYTVKDHICALYFLAPFSRPKNQSSAQPEIMLCLGRFQKGRPFLVLIWIFALLQTSQMASLAFFALLPLATARQILGTFEKFPESVSAESAGFQPIAALLEFDALGMCHPARTSAPPRSVSFGNFI